MRTKSILWAAMSMIAALMMTSCSSDDVQDWPTPTTKTIPYTVTVSQGTRATVDGDLSTLRFAEGDKLSISGTNISGVLDMKSGEGETTATFSGNLTCNGVGDPADDLSLTATLVSAQQSGSELTYPTNAYCATVNEAVQKYSKLTGTGTYGARSFALSQGTAFLNFNITFDYGASAGDQISAAVTNNNIEICRANVETTETEDHKVVAKFVLPVASGTTLNSAMVMMNSKGAFISDVTLDGKVYNLNKTIGAFTINANGDKVLFAPGNLQATYDGSNWTWKFAANQSDFIGNDPGNTSVNDDSSKSFIDGPGTVDLFGWVGASSDWKDENDVRKFGITSSVSTGSTNGYGNVEGEAMAAEWTNIIKDPEHPERALNIQNDEGYKWRTPTNDEWDVVFHRTLSKLNHSTTNCFGYGNVNGVNGVILLPDGWDNSGSHGNFHYYAWNNVISYSHNTYSDDTDPTWSQMEAAGCVFLPATGYRHGNVVEGVGMYGNYWSSTAEVSALYQYPLLASYLFFYPSLNSFNSSTGSFRDSGFSVRLVRAAE